MFISETGAQKCKNMTIGDDRISIVHSTNENLIYVCRSSEKTKEKKVFQYLEIVKSKFELKF